MVRGSQDTHGNAELGVTPWYIAKALHNEGTYLQTY